MSGLDDTALPPLVREEDEPVFDQPWQAQVLAMADTLTEQGHFSASEWSASLGEELRRAEAAGMPDTPDTYYTAALVALEHLTAAGGAISDSAIEERVATWRRAYENTPHGQPVELSAGLKR